MALELFREKETGVDVSDRIRCVELMSSDRGKCEKALEESYDDVLDAVIFRAAFPSSVTGRVTRALEEDQLEGTWARPNAPVPGIDIRLLGTVATPTAVTPAGPDRETYFGNADGTRRAILSMFGEALDPYAHIEASLGRLAGGRSVDLPRASDGRRFAACSVRSLPDGQGLHLHHDYHYPLLSMMSSRPSSTPPPASASSSYSSVQRVEAVCASTR